MGERKAIEFCITIMELEHWKQLTLLETDNITAFNIMRNNILPKKSKVIDMYFFWIRDWENKKQINLY